MYIEIFTQFWYSVTGLKPEININTHVYHKWEKIVNPNSFCKNYGTDFSVQCSPFDLWLQCVSAWLNCQGAERLRGVALTAKAGRDIGHLRGRRRKLLTQTFAF